MAADGGSSKAVPFTFNALQPSTTLHTVEVHYQRHGPAEDVLKLSESYQPETLRNESWITFGMDGQVTSMRGESRIEDGTLFASSRLKNGQIVSEKDGVEDWRMAFGQLTVEEAKARYRDAQAQLQAEVAAHPGAPMKVIRGVQTVVIEQSRRPWTFQQGEISPGNYVSTYVHDLAPVEEVRRSYVMPDGSSEVRSEWVAVDADGAETVIESSDYLTTEVLTP